MIYDEEHAAYLEGRLEYLLAALVSEEQEVFVVFDTPPTIPGLSRSVLSLALRLPLEPKTTLADDEGMPYALQEAKVLWRAYVVVTQDSQDIRAAERWLRLTPDTGIVRPVLNRAVGQEENVRQLIRRDHREPASSRVAPAPEDPEATARPGSRIATAIWVEETKALQQIFRREEAPPVLRELLLRLDEDAGA